MEIPHKQVEELLCEAAEQKIIPLWQNLRRSDVAEKTPDEIVTIADRSCESFLMDHLPKLMEGSLVLGEISECCRRMTQMRSSHVDLYNHNEDAATYDRNVLRSEDPIREGYTEVLDWVAHNAGITQDLTVVELGSGTGNLTARLPPCRSLVCVDVSAEMSKIAKRKLDGASHISYVQADILEYFDADPPPFNVAISTYVVHHLTQQEKEFLFDQLVRRLLPGGRVLFGDLMLESAQEERVLIDHYRSIGDDVTADAIEEEFFWHVDASVSYLRKLGLSVETTRFSALSWGIKIYRSRVASA